MKKLLLPILLAGAPAIAFAGSFTFTDGYTNAISSNPTSANDPGNGLLSQLTHETAYTWGLGGTTGTNAVGGQTHSDAAQYSSLQTALDGGQKITGATLTIYNIYDWTNEPADVLYVNILTGLSSGVKSYTWGSEIQDDVSYGPDFFATSSGHLSYHAVGAPSGGTSLLKDTQSYDQAGNPGTWSDPIGGSPTNHTNPHGFNLVINLTPTQAALLQNDIKTSGDQQVGLGFAPDCHYYDQGVSFTVTTGSASAADRASTAFLLGISLLTLLTGALLRRQPVPAT